MLSLKLKIGVPTTPPSVELWIVVWFGARSRLLALRLAYRTVICNTQSCNIAWISLALLEPAELTKHKNDENDVFLCSVGSWHAERVRLFYAAFRWYFRLCATCALCLNKGAFGTRIHFSRHQFRFCSRMVGALLLPLPLCLLPRSNASGGCFLLLRIFVFVPSTPLSLSCSRFVLFYFMICARDQKNWNIKFLFARIHRSTRRACDQPLSGIHAHTLEHHAMSCHAIDIHQ